MVDVVRTEAEVSWANGERVSLDLVRRVVCADQSGKEKDGTGRRNIHAHLHSRLACQASIKPRDIARRFEMDSNFTGEVE